MTLRVLGCCVLLASFGLVACGGDGERPSPETTMAQEASGKLTQTVVAVKAPPLRGVRRELRDHEGAVLSAASPLRMKRRRVSLPFHLRVTMGSRARCACIWA